MSSSYVLDTFRICRGDLHDILTGNWTQLNDSLNGSSQTPGSATTTTTTTTTGSDSGSLWIRIILPVICCLGIMGNTLNIVVLTKKRKSSPLRKLERSVNIGLTALAVSDLFFNVVVFPYCFIPPLGTTVSPDNLLWLYYRIYGLACINLFLMISTWLIVLLAMERYIVLYIPIRAKWFSCVNKAKLLILAVYLSSCALTTPHFLHMYHIRCDFLDGSKGYELRERWDSMTLMGQITNVYIRWLWPTFAVFVPLPILMFCNLRLIQGLKRVPQHRRNSAQGQKVKNINTRITLTLVIIIFMAIVLVTPAEILKFIDPYRLWGKVGHTLASVANLLQAASFAFNFVLYSTIDVTFRKICRNFVKIRCLITPNGDSQVNILKKGPTATSQKGSSRVRWKMSTRLRT